MGNHDERIALDLNVFPLTKHSPEEQAARVRAIEYTRGAITFENREYLAGLPRQLRLSFEGHRRSTEILLVHGSTRNIDEYVLEDHPEDDLQEMFQASNADVIVMGHTHLPYIRSIGLGEKLVLNTGSVGRSKERSPFASYLTLTVAESKLQPEIIRVPYRIEDTIRAIRDSEIPDFYAEFLLARTPE
jgi:predicted phosphodiesterase